MNVETQQPPLFDDPVGSQLRRTREKAGLGVEQVGQQLKLPVAIVEAMEREDWARLGAPVYVRSYLGSYLRLLGLPAGLADPVLSQKAEPALVTMASRSRMRHALDKSLRNAVYLVMTAVLVVPVVLVARHFQARETVAALTLEPDAVLREADQLAGLALPPQAPGPALVEPAPPPVSAAGPHPVMASMAPVPAGSAAAAAGAPASAGLALSFTEESWIEVLDGAGQRVERGLVAAGEQRHYGAGQVARITLGNADAVEARLGGKPLDLAPFRAANVARFAVSSDGNTVTPGH